MEVEAEDKRWSLQLWWEVPPVARVSSKKILLVQHRVEEEGEDKGVTRVGEC